MGQGYDIHRLAPGRKLILAGVEIPCDRGLVGHSDGDVVLHAVIDALLGAAGLADIGTQFPDTDPAYKDADSRLLLLETLRKVKAKGLTPLNVDTTVIAEKPRLRDHKPTMRKQLAQMLNLNQNAVSIKAKTHEGLGDIGAARAVACQALVSLTKIEDNIK